MSIIALIILITLLCVVAMFVMMNIPKNSSSKQKDLSDNDRIIGKEDARDIEKKDK